MVPPFSFRITLCALAALAGCLLFGVPALQAQDPTSAHILKPNDTVRLEVFNEPKLSVPEARISKTGEASFPLIGSVPLAGLTVGAATEKIRQMYDADWLVDPKITLTIINYAAETVSVLGSVQKPGQLALNSATGLDFATALAIVGGLSQTADPQRIELHRASGESGVYSLNDITNGPAGKVRLASGDRIIVGQSRFVGTFVTIIGNVAKQGAVSFPVDGKLDLITSIAAAGGPTPLANTKKISINRGGKVTEVDYNALSKSGAAPYMLEPGDIITVPQRIW